MKELKRIERQLRAQEKKTLAKAKKKDKLTIEIDDDLKHYEQLHIEYELALKTYERKNTVVTQNKIEVAYE